MIRVARAADAAALRDLEKEANLVALRHVFPPDRFPFPEVAVLERWRAVLADPSCTTLVVDRDASPVGTTGLAGFVAFDAALLRHLAVHPDRWGTGLARRLVEAAVARMGAEPRLRCLVANHRARGLYEHLGWTPTGVRRRAEWPPYPEEMDYALGPRGNGC